MFRGIPRFRPVGVQIQILPASVSSARTVHMDVPSSSTAIDKRVVKKECPRRGTGICDPIKKTKVQHFPSMLLHEWSTKFGLILEANFPFLAFPFLAHCWARDDSRIHLAILSKFSTSYSRHATCPTTPRHHDHSADDSSNPSSMQ
jgi:hypothetical protein